jgi:hypothetical protein
LITAKRIFDCILNSILTLTGIIVLSQYPIMNCTDYTILFLRQDCFDIVTSFECVGIVVFTLGIFLWVLLVSQIKEERKVHVN